jgi:hypothetical protein
VRLDEDGYIGKQLADSRRKRLSGTLMFLTGNITSIVQSDSEDLCQFLLACNIGPIWCCSSVPDMPSFCLVFQMLGPDQGTSILFGYRTRVQIWGKE